MGPRASTALALLMAGLLAACGSGSSPPGSTDDASTSEAYRRAELTRLPRSALPDGWSEVPVKERLGSTPGVPHYCGVRAAPIDVLEGRITTYDEGRALSRYVIAWGLVATEEAARNVMAALGQHRESCVQEDGRTGRPVQVDVGDESLGWAFDEPREIAFQTIVFRRDDTIVVLAAPADTRLPDAQQRAIASAIDEQLQSGER